MSLNISRIIRALLLLSVIFTCPFFFTGCADSSNQADLIADEHAFSDQSDTFSLKDEPFWVPDERGPYDVGVFTTAVVDENRWEVWGLKYRTLPLEVWYPSTGYGETNHIYDMIGEVPDWGWTVLRIFYGIGLEKMLAEPTTAIRDAGLIPQQQFPHPVVIFSHGLTAVRFQNYSLCEHLASHGFIVVAPDHYGNAVFTNIPDGSVVLFNPLTTVTSAFDRPIDIEFLVHELEKMNQDPANPLAYRLDLEHIGLTGHSYGGLTAMLGGPMLDCIDAIAPINPGWYGGFFTNFVKPFLLLQSELDSIVGIFNPHAKQAWDNSPSDKKIWINLLDGGHYSATDACLLLPESMQTPSTGCTGTMIAPEQANLITYSYITAFFKSVLTGDQRYDAYLADNHFPDDIEYTVIWP